MRPNELEVLMLELVNAERLERGRQALAHEGDLVDAARGHSRWMLDADTLSHTGRGGSSAGDRMRAEGYDFTGSWTWGENVGWYSLRAPNGLEDEVRGLHDGLMNSSGHRANILNDNFKEAGIGFLTGQFGRWDAATVTQNFARSGSDTFLTGVTIADGDGDGFYDLGEGRGGVTITATGADGRSVSAVSGAAGDYALALDQGSYTVTFSKAGMASVTETVQIGSRNVKLDLTSADARATTPKAPVDPTPPSDPAPRVPDPQPDPDPTPDPVAQTTERTVRDTADRKSWDFYTDTFDAEGARIARTMVFDNGDERTTRWEDGTVRERSTLDGDDRKSWEEQITLYDESGARTSREIVYDNGDSRIFTYEDGQLASRTTIDGSDRKSWASFTDTFENGRFVERTYVSDLDLIG